MQEYIIEMSLLPFVFKEFHEAEMDTPAQLEIILVLVLYSLGVLILFFGLLTVLGYDIEVEVPLKSITVIKLQSFE